MVVTEIPSLYIYRFDFNPYDEKGNVDFSDNRYAYILAGNKIEGERYLKASWNKPIHISISSTQCQIHGLSHESMLVIGKRVYPILEKEKAFLESDITSAKRPQNSTVKEGTLLKKKAFHFGSKKGTRK